MLVTGIELSNKIIIRAVIKDFIGLFGNLDVCKVFFGHIFYETSPAHGCYREILRRGDVVFRSEFIFQFPWWDGSVLQLLDGLVD